MDCTEEKLNLSQNAIKVLEKRYLKRDAQGNPTERPEDLFMRVASTLAAADKNLVLHRKKWTKLQKNFTAL